MIAKKAGKKYVDECNQFVKGNLKLKPGTCVVTSAGNLPFRYVTMTA